MHKYLNFSTEPTIGSFTDLTSMPDIDSKLKFSNEYSVHMPTYMQNIFTNKFDKLVTNTQSIVEDNNSLALKYKSCIMSKDNNVPRTKRVQFSETTIHITKPEQKNIYPSSNELYTYEKIDNYSDDYHNFLFVNPGNKNSIQIHLV